jgi:hypothetical protein
MGVLRGANLVGMSLLPLDVCPFFWLSKKKLLLLYIFIFNIDFNIHAQLMIFDELMV